jgi:predicted transcriptional regulator
MEAEIMTAEEAKQDTPVAVEKAAAPKEAKAAQEKQINCLSCGKPIKKLKRYYRNGKFYCSKKCWRKTLKPKTSQ